MSLTRRLFLGRAAAGAAAGPIAASAVVQSLPGSYAGLAAGMRNAPTAGCSGSSSDWNDPVKALLRKTLRSKQKTAQERRDYRIGGFDIDLLALGSVSLAGRVAAQRRRNRELEGPIDALHRQIWPEDWA